MRIEPFAALFWALGIALAHILKKLTQPASLASLNSGTGMVLYGRGQLPAFSDLAIHIIYQCFLVTKYLLKALKDMVLPDMVPPDMVLPDMVLPDMVLPDMVPPDMVLPDMVPPDMVLPKMVPPDMDPPDMGPPA